MKGFKLTRQVRLVFLLALLTLSLVGVAVQAQDGPPLPGEVIVGDLSAPRGVAFDANGNLLVSVAGTGGDVEMSANSPEGTPSTFNIGLTGVVLSIAADGTSSPLIQGLPSYAGESEITGVYRAIPNGDAIWLVTTSAGPGAFWGSTVVELDAATLMSRRVIAMTPYEVANNPDGNEIDSNVSDIAWLSDGTMLIVDAGANTLYSWTEADGLQVAQTWSDNSVPTSIEVAENDDVYIGFLGAGLAPGAGKVEHWSGGELLETFGGLNAVTDILLDGETLYAVQLVIFGEQGPGPGNVVMVNAEGATPVAEGIPAPFGIAMGADGALYVSFGTIAFAPGMTGGVLRVEPGM